MSRFRVGDRVRGRVAKRWRFVEGVITEVCVICRGGNHYFLTTEEGEGVDMHDDSAGMMELVDGNAATAPIQSDMVRHSREVQYEGIVVRI